MSYAMRLILYDTRVLSLVSTVTPDDSKTVIEHEIIFIKKKINFWLLLVGGKENFLNERRYISSYNWTTIDIPVCANISDNKLLWFTLFFICQFFAQKIKSLYLKAVEEKLPVLSSISCLYTNSCSNAITEYSRILDN